MYKHIIVYLCIGISLIATPCSAQIKNIRKIAAITSTTKIDSLSSELSSDGLSPECSSSSNSSEIPTPTNNDQMSITKNEPCPKEIPVVSEEELNAQVLALLKPHEKSSDENDCLGIKKKKNPIEVTLIQHFNEFVTPPKEFLHPCTYRLSLLCNLTFRHALFDALININVPVNKSKAVQRLTQILKELIWLPYDRPRLNLPGANRWWVTPTRFKEFPQIFNRNWLNIRLDAPGIVTTFVSFLDTHVAHQEASDIITSLTLQGLQSETLPESLCRILSCLNGDLNVNYCENLSCICPKNIKVLGNMMLNKCSTLKCLAHNKADVYGNLNIWKCPKLKLPTHLVKKAEIDVANDCEGEEE